MNNNPPLPASGFANQYVDTAIGGLNVIANTEAVVRIEFDADPAASQQPNAVTQQCVTELLEYFAGSREQFDVAVSPQGTDFQKEVWQSLIEIRFGQTCSYSDIARRLNNPKAVRAVGAANGKNPIPVIIPCHRVIGASGKLTGYAGGLDKKMTLLSLEKQ